MTQSSVNHSIGDSWCTGTQKPPKSGYSCMPNPHMDMIVVAFLALALKPPLLLSSCVGESKSSVPTNVQGVSS